MTRIKASNGLAGNLEADRDWRRRSAVRYAEKRRAVVVEVTRQGERTVARRKPIKPVSDRRAEQLADYRPLRDAYLEAHPQCERCGKPTTCLHHKRGRVGALLIAVEYWAPSCAECNDYAETHTGAALAEGWLLRTVGVA